MPGGPGIDPLEAVKAFSLADLGYTPQQISQKVNISRPSLYYIFGRHGKWGEIADTPVFNRLRREQNQLLEASYRTIAASSLMHAMTPEKIAKASYYQLIVGSSIATDKAQLLAGLPTEISMSNQVTEFRAIDQLAEALARSLVSKKDDVIEIPKEENVNQLK